MLKLTEPKKVLCIHDLSGVGRCSLAVILPVLSVMGVQPVALPTVVLSTHTGGFGTPARLDGCDYGMAALEHYRKIVDAENFLRFRQFQQKRSLLRRMRCPARCTHQADFISV